MADLYIQNEGSIFLLRALTDAGRSWIDWKTFPTIQPWWRHRGRARRYRRIVQGAVDDGLGRVMKTRNPYIRVSTQRRASPVSASRTRCCQPFASPGFDIPKFFTEEKPAKTPMRSTSDRSFSCPGRSPENQLTRDRPKLDRLSRDVAFIAGLMSNRVPFTFAIWANADPFMLHNPRCARRARTPLRPRAPGGQRWRRPRGTKLGSPTSPALCVARCFR
jgi:hypothetical protein